VVTIFAHVVVIIVVVVVVVVVGNYADQ